MLTSRDRHVAILILLLALVLFSASILRVNAQTTTIVDLHYPSQVVLQNGVAQAIVTFIVAYGGLPSGDAIVFAVVSLGPIPSSTGIDGSGSSTPDSCLSSWAGQSWPGKAACAVVPSSSSGTESVTLTIKSAASPQQYTLEVMAIIVGPSVPYSPISSSMSHQVFTITVVTAATDWAVLSVSLSPSAPNVGDPVTFSMVVTALSSTGSFPQSFSALCQIDGVSCGGGSLSYPGPMGTPFTVSTQTPWIATPGTHTLTWGVATIPVDLDPNKSNNAMSKSFTVAPQVSISSTTTPEYQNYVLPLIASFALVIIILAKKTGNAPHQVV